MTMRIVLVDDEPLARERLRSLAMADGGIEVVAECGDGASAVTAIETLQPDLVLLDVQLPEMDGFEVLEALSVRHPAIVFVTAYDEFALRAFEVAAVDYLLKPIEEDRFRAAIARVRARGNKPDTRFVVRRGERITFVRCDEVEWIEASGNYLRLKSEGQTHLTRETMKGVELQLDAARFVRIHRSVMVNTAYIAAMEPRLHGEWTVAMSDGTRFTSSRSLSRRLRAMLR